MCFLLRLVRERYEGMEEPWGNRAKEMWDRVLVDAFNTCATTLRSAPTGGDMELQQFSGSRNRLALNQNATVHITYFSPRRFPSDEIACHELERIGQRRDG
ncbi:hypothetical protein BS47DRAFT_1339525 [Hydnum rufescens UP504]|uniref:Uncharacterized protein n=1 Tax=Hydnum rufescens UP504 TaxID=1448309 RepID=A0A9P6B4N3_9AGAM|nr:hypothetical protein BS47DRAFT_1339525 [Hydnum rufescens UP504]